MVHLVDDAVVEPPYVHKKRKAGEYILYFVKRGEMHLLEDGAAFTLLPGDVCILDKDRTHEGTRASSCEYFYVHFMHSDFHPAEMKGEEEMVRSLMQMRQDALKSDSSSYDQCKSNTVFLPRHWNIVNTGDRIRMSGLLQQAKQNNYDPLEHYKLLCACKIQQLFIEISRSFVTAVMNQYYSSRKYAGAAPLPVYYERVQEILEWLNREYAAEITGELLEKKFGNNFDYMNRIFKRVMGQTIFQYLTKIRIQSAKSLLLHTPMRMGAVGERVGFPDEYYFNRVFKKQVGVPPATYARRMAADRSADL